MTVVNTTNRWSYPADGITTTFPYDNRIFEAGDLEVYLDGVKQASGYTVSGVDAPTGGNVVFAAAPAVGTVLLYRNVPATQKTRWPERDPFPSAAQERAVDKLTVLVQQVLSTLGRTLKRPPTSASTASLDLPDPIAGRALKFGTDGALTLSALDPDTAATEAAASAAAAAASAGEAANAAETAAADVSALLDGKVVAATAAKTSAEAARDQVLALYDAFDDRYLGVHASDPAADNDGNPLFPGALYFQQTEAGVDGVMKVYTGSAWVAAYVSGDSILTATNLLALLATFDTTQQATARANIGAASAADVAAIVPGRILQVVYAENTAATSGNTAIPLDDTIPQITEGFQILTASITPSSAANRVRVRVSGSVTASSGSLIAVALFRNGGANAIASRLVSNSNVANYPGGFSLDFIDVPGSTSAQTYTVRIGANSTQTLVLNGYSGARIHGGASRAVMELEEIAS